MTRNVTTAAPEDNLEDVMQIMTTGHFRHVPIIEGDEIKGLLSIRDVVEAVLYDRDHENQNLKEYVLGLR
jgi:CBS domain-containing protein